MRKRLTQSAFAEAVRGSLAKRRRGPLTQPPQQRVLLYCAVAILAIYVLFPFYWTLISAFREQSILLRTHSLLPGPFTLDGIQGLFDRAPFLTYSINSMIVAITVTIVTLVISTPVAYLLARYKSPLVSLAAISILVAYMFPEVLILMPIYVAFVNMHLDDTLIGLIIALLPGTIPLGIWLMVGFLRTLPLEIEEAAFVDGATWLQTFWMIVLPIARPGLLTVGIFSFILAWTDYMVAFTMIRSDEYKTLPVGLASLFGAHRLGYGEILSGALFIVLPIGVGLVFLSRYFISGMTQGSVKG